MHLASCNRPFQNGTFTKFYILSRRFRISNCHQHIAGTHSLPFPLLVQCKPIWSPKSMQIQCCDPMCQLRKISSLFGTWVTTKYQQVSSHVCEHCKLNQYFVLFKSKFYFFFFKLFISSETSYVGIFSVLLHLKN